MVLFSMLGWWYSSGWLQVLQNQMDHMRGVLNFFSITQLLSTLFSPYRQISAGSTVGPVGARLRAWGDRQFSRIIGSIVRSILIIVGLLSLSFVFAVGVVICVVWPLLPLLPVLSMIIVGVL